MLESKKVYSIFLIAYIDVSTTCTELDDSNPLDISASSSSVEQAEGSTTTVDDMVEATDDTSPSENYENEIWR